MPAGGCRNKKKENIPSHSMIPFSTYNKSLEETKEKRIEKKRRIMELGQNTSFFSEKSKVL